MKVCLTYSILISLLTAFLSLSAQEQEVRPGDFLYGFSAGATFSKLNIQGADKVKAYASPFVGLSASYVLNPKWRTNFSGYFSSRTSVADNYYRVHQTGIDLQLFQQYKIDDFYLNFGLQSQLVANQRFRYEGRSDFRFREDRREYSVPTYQLVPMLGLEFKLMDNWRAFANYSHSFKEDHNGWQFGLSYRINKRSATKESERSRRKRLAKRQIRQLRDGALLVRLKTSKPAIEAMRARGLHQLAEETEEAQRVENTSLMKAFRAAYGFSEIQFFYSEDSKKLKDGDLEGIFLNDNLQKDSAIILHTKKNIFTCELTNIEEDTAKYFSHYALVQTGNFSFKQVPMFYGGGENTFYALVIKDRHFNQLSRPFPYYSRALFKSMQEHPGHGLFYLPLRIFFSGTPMGSVESLNHKLFKYWKKVEEE